MADTAPGKPRGGSVDPPAAESKAKSEPKPKAEPKASTNKPRGRQPDLQKKLQELFEFTGIMVSNFNMKDGEIVMKNAEPLAKAWYDLSREDKRVEAALKNMLTGSAWSQVIFVTGGMAFAIAANHGLSPFQLRGDDDGAGEGEVDFDFTAPAPPSPPIPGMPAAPRAQG